ncbi:transcription initiation factor TFIID subunit 1 [Trichoderma cornu-damae]|uniref:Transcription initiation factor TFIID subunit 1 n=1 Tax=Trichoderma cornu-damae TaxID=654480 RepID=A0A9P8QNC2_9HYPO|nr:transcription initiation factor TFIID subunit 1 [Trichoderma cornu-damae]
MADDIEFSSFDEKAWKAQDAADEREIARLLEQSQDGTSGGLKLDDTPFDQTNKADDAEDFEDISDDDLPEEEEPNAGTSLEVPGLTDDGNTSNDADDLFGEGPSSPIDPVDGPASPAPHVRDAEAVDDSQAIGAGISFGAINFDPDPHLNGADNQDPDIPAPAESIGDLLKATWPAYKRGHILTWSQLLPPKKATWKEKKPLKKPKYLVTSKLSLDLEPDDEKLFRIPGPASSTAKAKPHELAINGLVHCDLASDGQEADAAQFDLDPDSDAETVMGFTLRDIELACEDWNVHIDTVESDFAARQLAAEQAALSEKRHLEEVEPDDEWDAEFLMDMADDPQPLQKKRKVVRLGLPEIPRYTAPSFDNFEDATRRGAKRVNLDTSDPYLLLETDSYNPIKRPRQEAKMKRMANGNMGPDVSQRFNLSNDEAYELLKENHQSKVRATLGNISVEHGMPALKLSWPYYKVKLGGTTDEYHRPRFRYKKTVGHTVKFEKPLHFRRKQMKGKAHEIFLKSKDLSLCDNSVAVLFEYCEPRPRVLNSFAMGSRLINYYRRKENGNEEDQLARLDLGEYRTLLPEDRSPFSLFGTVEPGEVVPTLHNEMYRAPVFKHAPRSTDFLVVRSTTGIGGPKWYIHKIDHLHVVGQTFPSVDVPGPHSRRVTNASKSRMKMLAFRMIRHSRSDNCQLSDITKHIAESTDTQNRQKLKEFLQYDRDSKEKGMWRLKPGEILPDENAIRAMIKPEEVCLLDAMQLGIKELEDAGYDPRNATIDDDAQGLDADDEEDDDGEGSKTARGPKKTAERQEETLADKMAPWKTTKAFIDACAQKAMLQLHGEGDPTGHGLGFSFIRTSMKGGYIEAVQGPLATSADAMEREKRANGGHAYNVKRQQAMYEEGIREIWDKQRANLSDTQEHDVNDIAMTEDEDDRFNVQSAATPAVFDDGTSQISGLTSSSRHPKRAIRISREVELPDGTTQTRIEVVHDPVVISQYIKRRTEADLEMREYVKAIVRFRSLPKRKPPKSWSQLPTSVRALLRWSRLAKTHARKRAPSYGLGSPGSVADVVGLEFRAPAYVYFSTVSTAQGLRAMPTMTVLRALELERLEKNKARRQAREQQKELHQKASAGDAGSPGADKIPTGTTRKCANCGQVGHIKTNKKYGVEDGASSARRNKKAKTSTLARKMKQSDIQARKQERARLTKRGARNGRIDKKNGKQDEKDQTQEELERDQALREEREQLQTLKRELQQKARQEREERERVQGFPDRAWWRAAAGDRPQ